MIFLITLRNILKFLQGFQKYFSDFEKKYGFNDMYSGGFTDFESLEENWAYWSRQIFVNRYANSPKPVYEKFKELHIKNAIK